MSESVPLLKLVEVLVVLAAGVGFAWWQFSDLARARRERERQDAAAQDGSSVPDKSAASPQERP
jgi:hypothetical protein